MHELSKAQMEQYALHQQHHANMRLILQSLQEMRTFPCFISQISTLFCVEKAVRNLQETMASVFSERQTGFSSAIDTELDNIPLKRSRVGETYDESWRESNISSCKDSTMDFIDRVKHAHSNIDELQRLLHEIDDIKFSRLDGMVYQITVI